MNLQFTNETETEIDDTQQKLFKDLAENALLEENILTGCSLSLTITNDAEIRKINKKYRLVDEPTDVLSFPQFSSAAEIRMQSLHVLLGDVVISLEAARRQAEEYGHSLKRELSFLFIHGFLHILGYDHADKPSDENMTKRQSTLLDNMGIHR